ncbi:MAG: hypothetical protein M0Q01_10255 [Syntrophales bacterium]|jgi:hypothetical protein|nr:hypothetical protein [Syntrophales bacterium]
MQTALSQAMKFAAEIEKFPLGNCGPSDDPDMQTAYLYAFRDLAKRFVSSARRIGDTKLSTMIGNLNTSPGFITDAYDLRAELFGIIDYLKEASANPNFHITDTNNRTFLNPAISKERITKMKTDNWKSAYGWKEIEKEYDISKRTFGKRINFVKDPFKRNIIFRDIEQAYFLASNGFCKPAVILAGSVIEELLRLYLESKRINLTDNTLNYYIKTCIDKHILKKEINKLADTFREFRNIVHLAKEESKRNTISRPTAKSAVASIFTIANDFDMNA